MKRQTIIPKTDLTLQTETFIYGEYTYIIHRLISNDKRYKKREPIGSHFLFYRVCQMTSFDHRIDWDHKAFYILLN